MHHASYFQRLYDHFQERAIFRVVYIAEAHAADEWPIGPTTSFCKQPKDRKERCALAERFTQESGIQIPVLVDSMDNSFDRLFAAWPLRFFVIDKEGKLAFKAQPNMEDYAYDPVELEDWLDTNT